jgi:hypothetical protein
MYKTRQWQLQSVNPKRFHVRESFFIAKKINTVKMEKSIV